MGDVNLYRVTLEYVAHDADVITFEDVFISGETADAAHTEANRLLNKRASEDYTRAFTIRPCSALEMVADG